MVAFPTHRKTAAARLSIVADGRSADRPEPPDYLNDEAGEQWWLIVNRMPANYFTAEYQPLLAAYCQHIVIAISLTEKLRIIDEMDIKEVDYKTLRSQNVMHAMLTREHRTMALLATRLKLIPAAELHETSQKQRTARRQEPAFRSAVQVDDSAS
jgi:phage terminase small subunit